MRVRDACADVIRHPHRHLIRRWNWKNAVFSACLRGALFFGTNLVDGLPWAARALAVDLAFRVPLSGIYPALTQALRSAEPEWAAVLVLVVVLPATSHVIEFLVHWTAGTPELRTSIVLSISISVLSTFFNLFTMRRGYFIVGETARPLREDLARLPMLIVDFVLAPFRRCPL